MLSPFDKLLYNAEDHFPRIPTSACVLCQSPSPRGVQCSDSRGHRLVLHVQEHATCGVLASQCFVFGIYLSLCCVPFAGKV